jgi:hypothetical protein
MSQIGAIIGGAANSGIIQVSSDPDGTLTAPMGTRAIDAATGVVYVNENGGTQWWPDSIPGRAGWWVEDEFMNTVATTYATTGGGAWSSPASPAATPGIRQATVSAVSDTCVARAGNTSGLLVGGGKFRFRGWMQLNTLGDGTNAPAIRVGAHDSINGSAPTDAVHFEYSNSFYGDQNWRLCTKSNGVGTALDTGIAATTAMTRFDLIVDASGSLVSGRINGVATPTVSTNIPTGAGRQIDTYSFQFTKSLGAGALTFNLDRVECCQILTVGR